jgi:hypothetical protein
MPLSLARKRPILQRRPEPTNELTSPVVHSGRDVVELGTIVKPNGRMTRYVTVGGAEYRVGDPTSDPVPGHYLQGADRDTFLPLVRLELGTYHRTVTGQPSTQPAKPPRVVDVLTTLPALRGTPDVFLPMPPAPLGVDPSTVAGPMTNRPASGYVEGRPRIATFRGALARYQSRAELSVVGGRLLVRAAPGRLTPNDWDALRVLAPHLVALLLGDPTPCALEHAEPVEAVTLLAVDVPACEAHAR